MTRPIWLTLLAMMMALATMACGYPSDPSVQLTAYDAYAQDTDRTAAYALAAKLTADDEATRLAAADELRALGPAGLQAVFRTYEMEVSVARENPTWNPERWQTLSPMIDRVAGQRDAYASGLYWYDDLATARTVAAAQGKPILSLRLLGQLDESLTCANSRFFRTVLYSDPELAGYLRETYVLHWQSVREVPIITIDLRNGRQIKQTITGNSLHWILAADGTMLDALPGVYTAPVFRSRLESGASVAATWLATSEETRGKFLARHYGAEIVAIQKQWGAELAAAGVPLDDTTTTRLAALDPTKPPTARDSSMRTMSKAAVERPMFRALGLDTRVLDAAMSDRLWLALAANRPAFVLSDNSRALIHRQAVNTPDAPDGLSAAQIESLQTNVAIETVKNEYRLRHEILQAIASNRYADDMLIEVKTNDDPASPDRIELATNWVYANVFRTPLTDPWLGLAEPTVYTALPQGGLHAD